MIKHNDPNYILNHYVSSNQVDSFSISLYCNQHHIYVINWISDIGINIPAKLNVGYMQSPTPIQVPFQTLELYGETLDPIYYANGWNYLTGSTWYGIRQTLIDSTTISFTPNNLNQFFYLLYYTLFKTYKISDSSLDCILDNQPKSVQAFIVQRGFSIQISNIFMYLPDKRNSTYFSIKPKYHNAIYIYDWLVVMASQRCRNKTGPCDFYQSYDSNCNLQLDFCKDIKAEPNYFLNSSYYYECNQNVYLECHLTCRTCIGNAINQCSTCYTEQNMNLQNGKCVYNSDINCLTCSSALNTTCLSCVLYATLLSNKCVCNDGYYFANSQCSNCSHQCLTCLSYDECLKCPNPLQRNGDTCDCGDSQYYDENNICYGISYQQLVCPQKCRTCINDFVCTSCIDNLQIFGVGDCLCPSGYQQDDDFHCQTCSINCVICADFSSCNECINGMIIVNGQCVCNNKYYKDSDSVCQQCNIQCRTCDGPLANQCLTCDDDRYQSSNHCFCKPGYYVVNQRQCSVCPTNFEECLNQYICTNCRTGYLLVDETCVCQQGYYESDNNCYPCNTSKGKYILQCNYVDCKDQIWTPSEQCDDGNDINRDGCTNCKIDKDYNCLNKLNQKSICYQCPSQLTRIRNEKGKLKIENFIETINSIETMKVQKKEIQQVQKK